MTTVETASLYACTGCDKYHVMSGTPDLCPAGNDIELVTPDSTYADYSTCANPDCSHALGMSLTIEGGRCDHCSKRLGKKAHQLVADDGTLVEKGLARLVYVPPMEEKGSHAARSLEDAVEKAEGFKTAHHKDKKGHHTAGASATHARGNEETVNVRKQKRKMILLLVEKLEASSTYDLQTHDALIRRANTLAEKWK